MLKLPAIIQKGLLDKQITVGHAKALVNIETPDSQVILFQQIIRYDYSVRKVEEIVRKLSEKPLETEKTLLPTTPYPEKFYPVKQILDALFPSLVKFTANEQGQGKITLSFKTEEDLGKIVKILENMKLPE